MPFNSIMISNNTQEEPNGFPLAMANEGERVRIARLHGGYGLESRLTSLGLNRGSEIEVLHRQGGDIVVQCGDNRLALGAGMANKVMVVPV